MQCEATEETLCLDRLHVAYPTLIIADDIVYLLSKGTRRGAMPMVFSVNLKARALQGLVEPTTRYRGFMHCYFSSGISKYLKPTGNLCTICVVCVENKTMLQPAGHGWKTKGEFCCVALLHLE